MMNNLLLRKDMCHWSRGMQIRLVYCYTHFIFLYHLCEQTGRFTAWVNGSKIRIYYLKKSVPLTGKRPRRPETGIKDALKKWTMNFRSEHSLLGRKDYLSNVPLLPEIFCRNDPKSRVPFNFQPDSPETFLNGKQPLPSCNNEKKLTL